MVRIGLFTEFPTEFSQFHKWFKAHGIKYGFDYNSFYTPNIERRKSNCWDGSQDIDFALVYCSFYCHGADLKSPWSWWKLPLEVKKHLRHDAKIAVMWDFEGWQETGQNEPEGLKEVADAVDVCCTVFPTEKPAWKRLTKKPVVYLPLPYKFYENYGVPVEKRENKLVVFRHSSGTALANHILTNLIPMIKKSVLYIPTAWSSVPEPQIKAWRERFKLDNQSGIFDSNPNNKPMMKKIQHMRCAIDDNIGYFGWSRFAMECAIAHLPCITTETSMSGKLFFPELVTKHKEYDRQAELIEKLFTDNAFHTQISNLGFERVRWYLSVPTMWKYISRVIDVAFGKKSYEIIPPEDLNSAVS